MAGWRALQISVGQPSGADATAPERSPALGAAGWQPWTVGIAVVGGAFALALAGRGIVSTATGDGVDALVGVALIALGIEGTVSMIVVVVVVTVVGPVGEEVRFRGYIFRALRNWARRVAGGDHGRRAVRCDAPRMGVAAGTCAGESCDFRLSRFLGSGTVGAVWHEPARKCSYRVSEVAPKTPSRKFRTAATFGTVVESSSGYARVSTAKQGLDRQVDALAAAGIHRADLRGQEVGGDRRPARGYASWSPTRATAT